MSTTFWDTNPEKITVRDRVVQVAWFRVHDAHTIRLSRRQRLAFGSAGDSARHALRCGPHEALAMVARKGQRRRRERSPHRGVRLGLARTRPHACAAHRPG